MAKLFVVVDKRRRLSGLACTVKLERRRRG